jgi:hypothetical protein
MAFVAHLSFDDQNMAAPPTFQPGQGFVKSWRVRNTGTCPWDSRYRLVYVGGNHPAAGMAGAPVAIEGRVEPGSTYDLHVNLTAPSESGVYQGFWQMHDEAGMFFGERVRVGIQVPAQPTPTNRPPRRYPHRPPCRASSLA